MMVLVFAFVGVVLFLVLVRVVALAAVSSFCGRCFFCCCC